MRVGTTVLAPGTRPVPFVLTDTFATDTAAILAKRGTGKSNTAVVIAERMFADNHQWVAIDPKGDWHGIRSNAEGTGPGLPIPVFGGDHGDLPLTPTMGKFMAELIIDRGLTCILDVSDFDTKADQVRFLTDFGQAFYRAAKKDPRPRHLFLEEADEFLPQQFTGDALMPKCVGIWTKIIKLGRTAGIGATLITQRSASLNKGALTQIETLIVLRTPSPQDKAAIKAWLEVAKELADEIMSSLPSLDNGEAWVISPSSLNVVARVQFDRRATFDSGATPIAGEARPAPRLADIDLTLIKEQMAATLEQIEQEDPEALRRRIKELERELAATPAPERVAIPVIPAEVAAGIDELATLTVATFEAASELHRQANDVLNQVERDQDRVAELVGKLRLAGSGPPLAAVADPAREHREQTAAAAKAARAPAPMRPLGTDPDLDKCQRALLTALAQHPEGLTKNRHGFLAGYNPTKSTYRTGIGALRTKGYVTPGKVEPIRILDAGRAALGSFEALPTGPELLAYWMEQLDACQKALLGAFLAAYPQSVPVREIERLTGYDPSKSTYRTAMGVLRRLELVVRGDTRVTDEFMQAIR